MSFEFSRGPLAAGVNAMDDLATWVESIEVIEGRCCVGCSPAGPRAKFYLFAAARIGPAPSA
jgi:hypothetical protein